MANSYNSIHTGAWHDNQLSLNELFDRIYPVGSIYISMNETDPGTLFGGTWERISGRFLLGCGVTGSNANNRADFEQLPTDQQIWFSEASTGQTGGEYYHTLSAQEMPAHSHLLKSTESATNNGQGWSTYAVNYFADNGHYLGTTITGETLGHNNIPPYITVTMWQRIS